MKIWKKMILKRLVSTFIFILFSIFFIYCLIDFSINNGKFLTKNLKANLFDLIQYYLQNFSAHFDLFSPFSFLLATLKVFFDMNIHLEFTALQTAGLSRKKLLVPFAMVALFLSILGLANHEWIAPHASYVSSNYKLQFSKRAKGQEPLKLYSHVLEDGSEILYHSQIDKTLSDFIWIQSNDEIWTMKTLDLITMEGKGVHHIQRENRLLVQKESFETKAFLELRIDPETIAKSFIPYENRSISSLFTEKENRCVQSYFHYRLATPLLPLFLLFALAPFGMTFSRTLPIFSIVILSISIFITIKTVFESLIILGENNLIHPLCLWSPLLFIFVIFFHRFLKM